jgi:hypothetical protein
VLAVVKFQHRFVLLSDNEGLSTFSIDKGDFERVDIKGNSDSLEIHPDTGAICTLGEKGLLFGTFDDKLDLSWIEIPIDIECSIVRFFDAYGRTILIAGW